MKKGGDGKYRLKLAAANGEVVATSEAYNFNCGGGGGR